MCHNPSASAANLTSLNKMIPGQRGKVVGFNQDSPVTRRLLEMGLAPGRDIEYLRNAPLRDPMEIKAGSSYLSLRHTEAALVTIELDI